MNGARKISPVSFKTLNDSLYAYVCGEIDHHSAKKIRDEIDEKIFEIRPKTLYINLKDVDFMDSSGLGLIMGRYKLMKTYGGKTYIESPSHRVLKIIELSRMERIVEIVSKKEDEDFKGEN